MSGKIMAFGAGAAIGYLLGTRAGRQRYEELAGQAKRIWASDTVQEAAGVVQGQAARLYDEGRKVVSDRADKMSKRRAPGSPERNQEQERRQEPSSDDNLIIK